MNCLELLRLVCCAVLVAVSQEMEVHLTLSEDKLDPLTERKIFRNYKHRPTEYKVLQGLGGRHRRNIDPDLSLSLSLPLGNSEVFFDLTPIDIASPDLVLSFQDDAEGEEDMVVPHNCFYSGNQGEDLAVVSTCSGGLTGVVEHEGVSYQVERLEEEEEEAIARRRRRDVNKESLYIIFPLETKLSEKLDKIPVAPDLLSSTEEDPDQKSTTTNELSTINTSKASSQKSHDKTELSNSETRADRVRRGSVKGPYTVELGVFVDRDLYSYIKKRYPNKDHKTKTVEIVMTLVNAVHRLYSDKSLGKSKVGMLVKKIEVLGSTEPKNAGGNIYKYLKNFCSWQANIKPKAAEKHWDHALLLSGQDLYNEEPSQNSTVGLAYVGGMCTKDFSCTVNEATSFAAAFIISHEIGHNFNMIHDGTKSAKSCQPNKYIMSPVMASGATTWSKCSKNSMSDFLKLRGGCLISSATTNVDKKGQNHEGDSPGKRFDATQQCHFMYGKGWSSFTTSEAPFNNVCREIWCRKGRLLKTPSASALEGTSCGAEKVCKHGRCTKKAKTVKEKKKNKEKKKKDNDKKGSSNRKKTENKEAKKKKKKNNEKKTKKKNEKKTKKKNEKKEKVKITIDRTKVGKEQETSKQKGKKGKSKQKSSSKGDSTVVKEKTKISKKKKPKKIRRSETKTHIIIKERMEFVEGKGWKIKTFKIRKTKRMIEEEEEKARKKQKRKCKKKNKKKCVIKEKKEKNKDKRSSLSTPDSCDPQIIKYVIGKGWWVKVPVQCVKDREE